MDIHQLNRVPDSGHSEREPRDGSRNRNPVASGSSISVSRVRIVPGRHRVINAVRWVPPVDCEVIASTRHQGKRNRVLIRRVPVGEFRVPAGNELARRQRRR